MACVTWSKQLCIHYLFFPYFLSKIRLKEQAKHFYMHRSRSSITSGVCKSCFQILADFDIYQQYGIEFWSTRYGINSIILADIANIALTLNDQCVNIGTLNNWPIPIPRFQIMVQRLATHNHILPRQQFLGAYGDKHIFLMYQSQSWSCLLE